MKKVGEHGRGSSRTDQPFGFESWNLPAPSCSASASSSRPRPADAIGREGLLQGLRLEQHGQDR